MTFSVKQSEAGNDMESQIIYYFHQYGYIILFVIGFFGIVGIPVPEESFFVYIGILAKNDKLSFSLAWLCLSTGAFAGMLTSYLLGRKIGKPLLERYGRYLGMSKERWRKFILHWDMKKPLFVGFFIPGIRQFNPYFAGMSRLILILFVLLSAAGSLSWTFTYMIIGYIISTYIKIDPEYLAAVGMILFILFVIQLIYKWKKSKKPLSRQQS